ncbi:thiamine pyrophosphate-binding protein [Pseudochelatococcus sp. B33]
MKLAESVASAVVDEGVDTMFGVIGDGNMSIWAALAKQNSVSIYSARNEAGAVAMADGYFRGSGRPALVTLTSGPGLTQVGTSLVAASRARSELVIATGSLATSNHRTGMQKFDHKRFVDACEAMYVQVESLDTAAEEIAEAFYATRRYRRPVLLDVPLALQETELNWAWDYRPASNFIPGRPAANDDDVDRLVDLLATAQYPVIIAGRGARSPETRRLIIRLGEITGALLATSLQGKGMFDGMPYDAGISGSYASAASEEVLGQADLVLAVGAEFGYYTSEGGLLYPDAQIARIDISEPGKLGMLPGLHLRGDAAKTLARVVERLESVGHNNIGFRTKETMAVLSRAADKYESASDGLDPRLLMRHLSRAIPENALIVSGLGHFLGFVAMHLPVPSDSTFHVSIQFGSIGQTIPVAFGMALALPDKPCIVIEGDGSLMMNIQELDTIARYNRPTIVVVMNDAALGAEVHKLGAKGYEPNLAKQSSPDFVGLAQSLGGDGVLLDKEENIGDAIRRGLVEGGLFLVDARVSPTEMNDAYRKVLYGIPNRSPFLKHARSV